MAELFAKVGHKRPLTKRPSASLALGACRSHALALGFGFNGLGSTLMDAFHIACSFQHRHLLKCPLHHASGRIPPMGWQDPELSS